MWEINLNHQAFSVLLGIFMGAVFCLLFDLFKAIRLFFNLKTTGVFITDVLFFILISPVEFLFLLSRSLGEIRGFILLAELFGFFCFKYTFSKIFLKLLMFFLKTLKKIISLINNGFLKISDSLIDLGKIFSKKALFSRKKG